MLTLEYSIQFKKDFKKIAKMPIPDILEVGNIFSQLQRGETLPPKNVDHPLTGNCHGFRDCHIKPDLVLIYIINNDTIQLAPIGPHSELF